MYQGSYVALVTPFTDSGEVDFDAYGRLVDFQLENGTDGLVPCGCTGEAATLSHAEQKACIRFVVERVAGRVAHRAERAPGSAAHVEGDEQERRHDEHDEDRTPTSTARPVRDHPRIRTVSPAARR